MTVLLVASVVPVQAKREDKPRGRAPIVRTAEKHDSLKSLKGAKAKKVTKEGKVHAAQPLRKLPKAKGKGKYGPKSAGGQTTGSAAGGTSGTKGKGQGGQAGGTGAPP